MSASKMPRMPTWFRRSVFTQDLLTTLSIPLMVVLIYWTWREWQARPDRVWHLEYRDGSGRESHSSVTFSSEGEEWGRMMCFEIKNALNEKAIEEGSPLQWSCISERDRRIRSKQHSSERREE